MIIPNIVKTDANGNSHSTNLINHDFENSRVVYLIGEINSEAALSVCSQIRYLASRSDDDIILWINSPGGTVSDGMAIYDVITDVNSDVVTVGTGLAASMGAFLLSSGTEGKRYLSPNVQLMVHQPLGGVQGQATDIGLVADHIKSIKNRLAEIIAANCNKPLKRVIADMDRDKWMSAEEAVKYGLADHIGFPVTF